MEPVITTIFSLCLPYLAILVGMDCQEPYYDTSEIWEIHYYNKLDVDFECYGTHFPKSAFGGCVRMWPDSNGHYKIIMGINKIFQYQSLSTLEHEILHLMCKCNYHGGGTLRG